MECSTLPLHVMWTRNSINHPYLMGVLSKYSGFGVLEGLTHLWERCILNYIYLRAREWLLWRDSKMRLCTTVSS